MLNSSDHCTIYRSICWIVLLLLASPAAASCPICSPMPVQTIGDDLIDGRVVVFAKENPDRRFSYLASEILKGDLPDREIDLFVDSKTRRILKSKPESLVLLVQYGKKREWKVLAVMDRFFQSVVRRVLLLAASWTRENNALKRCEFFLPLWGHSNRTLSEWAYLELARSPYSKIKRIAQAIPFNDIRPLLEETRYLHWRPLAILILAQKKNREARDRINRAFRSNSQFQTTLNLSAWLTAYLELHGEKGLNIVIDTYLTNSQRSKTEISAVLQALSVLGTDNRTIQRSKVVECYLATLSIHPDQVALICKDLKEWNCKEPRNIVADILKTDGFSLDTDEQTLVNRYILDD